MSDSEIIEDALEKINARIMERMNSGWIPTHLDTRTPLRELMRQRGVILEMKERVRLKNGGARMPLPACVTANAEHRARRKGR